MKPWVAVAGTSEVALRLPSVIAAVGAVVLVYSLAYRLYGTRVAFVAALLLAVNAFVLQWSQQARGYTFLLLLGVGVVWLFLRAIERDDWASWALYGLAAVVLIHWHVLAGLALLPIVLCWGNRKGWLSGRGSSLLVSIPWLVALGSRDEDLFRQRRMHQPFLAE